MTTHTAIFKPYDVVVVPFPFTDSSEQKRRPALIVSNGRLFSRKISRSVMAMITSAQQSTWPLDVEIIDLNASGIRSPSLIRMKLFTLDHGLILKRIGHLSRQDQRACRKSLKILFDV